MSFFDYTQFIEYQHILHLLLAHILNVVLIDVWDKDSIIEWKRQIVNIPSQNTNTNPIKEGRNKKVSNRKEKPPTHLIKGGGGYKGMFD
mgnify:CR=1 FL=1